MNSKSHLYIFCPKKSSKTSKIYKIESLTFLRFKFLPLLSQSTSYSHALCHTVQRHIVLRRAQSVGMPRHALRRRMPNTAGLRPRSPARCGGETPTKFLEDSGRVLNPSSVLPAFVKKIWIGFGISWSNHRILKLERPPPDFPKISAPHRVPAWLKYFVGVHGRPLGVILGVKFISGRITFFLLI